MTKKTNTEKSFKDKWENNQQLFFSQLFDENSETLKWILQRNNWNNLDTLKKFLSDKKRVLDAGCGNGRVTSLLRRTSNPNETKIVGIDLVSTEIAKENLKQLENIEFKEKDLTKSLKSLGKFDFIYCQEVLHHTKKPEKSFKNLVDILEKDGTIAIYVYKKKAPIREFTDDFIRDKIKDLSYEKAIEYSKKITDLGKVLADLNIKIKVPEIDLLEIKEGEYELQRFIYHFFMKCFWNSEFSYEENTVINYDWFHPEDCKRYLIEEVEEWFKENNLKITHSFSDFYGITIHGLKI